MITTYLTFIPKALALIFLFSMTYIMIKENGKKSLEKLKIIFIHNKWETSFLIYTVFLFMGTIFLRTETYPLKDVFVFYGLYDNGKLNIDTVNNLLILAPLVFLYIMSFAPSKPFRATIILSASVSCCIEFVQLVFWLGSFQFEDIIYNIIGGLIGCFVCLVYTRVKTYIRKVMIIRKE